MCFSTLRFKAVDDSRLSHLRSGAFGERERERYKTVSAARTSMAFRFGFLGGVPKVCTKVKPPESPGFRTSD